MQGQEEKHAPVFAFDYHAIHDPSVAAIRNLVQTGMSEVEAMKVCIVQLVMRSKDLTALAIKLDAIRPRRYQTSEGVVRWDAPDSIVPIENLQSIPCGKGIDDDEPS